MDHGGNQMGVKKAWGLASLLSVCIFASLSACSTVRATELPAPQEAAAAAAPPPSAMTAPKDSRLPALPPAGSIPLVAASSVLARWTGAESATYSLGLEPGGTSIAATGEYGEVLLFSLDGRLERRFPVPGRASIWCLAWSGDGKTLALASPVSPSLVVDARTGAALRTGLPYAGCCDLALVPGARAERLALGGTSGMVSIVEAPGWEGGYEWAASSVGGVNGYLVAAAFSPDGRLLATGGLDFTLSVWHSNDGSLVGRWVPDTLARRDINGIAWSPDGSRIAATGQDGSLHIYSVDSGLEVWGVDFEGWLRPVAWSTDGRFVAAGGEAGRIVVFDASDGRPLLELAQRGSPVWALAFSRDSSVLVSGSGRNEAPGGDTAIVFTAIGDLE